MGLYDICETRQQIRSCRNRIPATRDSDDAQCSICANYARLFAKHPHLRNVEGVSEHGEVSMTKEEYERWYELERVLRC